MSTVAFSSCYIYSFVRTALFRQEVFSPLKVFENFGADGLMIVLIPAVLVFGALCFKGDVSTTPMGRNPIFEVFLVLFDFTDNGVVFTVGNICW